MRDIEFDKILRILNKHSCQVESHVRNLELVVSDRLHLIRKKGGVTSCHNLKFLHNLSGDPIKALQILRRVRLCLEKWAFIDCLNNEGREWYFSIMKDCVRNNFRHDFVASEFIDRMIYEIEIRIDRKINHSHLPDISKCI